MAYTSSVTLYTSKATRIGKDIGMLCGEVDITDYNSTQTEETDITKHFLPSAGIGADCTKGILSLTVNSSENGYMAAFDPATGKFKVYEPDYSLTAQAALIEVTDGDDVGNFRFTAIGFIK